MKHIGCRTTPLARWRVGACLLGALAAPWAMAQGVYRIVGPDGRVTYSDQPPPSANAQPVSGAVPTAVSGAPLPAELRQAVSRYPVTFYTSDGCSPCNRGRDLLNARGIPYTEKTVSSADDAAALKRLSGAGTLPLLTIGSQQIKGYSDSEWNLYLDAAGYPKQSVLPSSYRRPAATALVETASVSKPAAQQTEADRKRPPARAETPVAPPVNNPSGIRF